MAQVLDASIPHIHHGLARDRDLDYRLHVDVLPSVQSTSCHSAAAPSAPSSAATSSAPRAPRAPSTPSLPSKSPLESLPTEIVNQILSHLVHPRSRLPGLTEAQSAHDFPRPTKLEIKNREDLTTLPDSHRWAADIFDFQSLRHPFNVLALASKRLHAFVESYCAHLVRACNMFNLPFAHFDKYGRAHPDLSHIVYRRLWLQHAPRLCIYCHVGLDCYPFGLVQRLLAACEDCFYRQTLVCFFLSLIFSPVPPYKHQHQHQHQPSLTHTFPQQQHTHTHNTNTTQTVDEVERQYHISIPTITSLPHIRGPGPGSPWVLRVDVEAMAFRLYGTRAFHAAHVDQFGKPCSICAITRFEPHFSSSSSSSSVAATTRSERGLKRGTTRPVRRVVSLKRKARRSRGFGSS